MSKCFSNEFVWEARRQFAHPVPLPGYVTGSDYLQLQLLFCYL